MASELSGLGNAAVRLTELGYCVIPLAENGKLPVVPHGSHDWMDNPAVARAAWEKRPNANIALCCGLCEAEGEEPKTSGVVAIDLDCKESVNGIETLADWQMGHDAPFPETVEQSTPTGGRHLLFRTDRKMAGYENPARGVDLRAQSNYIVVEPSVHPNGGTYEWLTSPEDMDPAWADDNVYAFIEDMRPDSSRASAAGEWVPLNVPDVIPEGGSAEIEGRDRTIFNIACSCRSREVPRAEAEELCKTINRERCQPPLDDRTVLKCVKSAYKYHEGKSEQFKVVDGNAAVKVEQPAPPKPEAKDDEEEHPKSVWGIGEIIARDPDMRPLKLNELDGLVHVTDRCVPGYPFRGDHAINWETEGARLFQTYERDHNVTSQKKFDTALMAFAGSDGQTYNPIREMRDELPLVCYAPDFQVSWDGGVTWDAETPKRGFLLADYLKCDRSNYTYDVETLFGRQLAARLMWPGCKADVMLVITGKQGTGKSTFAKRLALNDTFFQERISKFDVEDRKRILGKIVVEVPELDGFNNTEKNQIKSFLTETKDNFRASYAKAPSDHPRTACFVGTTNDSAFLNDPTGSRRFAIVESHQEENQCDPRLYDDGWERDFKIWWAESVRELDRIVAELGEEKGRARFLSMCVLPERSRERAREINDAHSVEDKATTVIGEWLDRVKPQVVNVRMVACEAYHYSSKDFADAKSFVIQDITRVMDEAEEYARSSTKQTSVPGYGKTKTAWRRKKSPKVTGESPSPNVLDDQ